MPTALVFGETLIDEHPGERVPAGAPLHVAAHLAVLGWRVTLVTRVGYDADGKAMRDPPVIVLPNMKLMLMENALSTSGRDLRFRVTGMLTAYRGRNYIMLEKVVVIPDAAQPF